MIVADASVLANAVGDDGPDGTRAREVLSRRGPVGVPDLADVETAAVLRKRWLAGDLDERRFGLALADLLDLDLDRYPSLPLLTRGCELKANVSVYDGVYVALAEGLGCSLVTADARLASTPGPRCEFTVLART